jgi:cytidine deaminase
MNADPLHLLAEATQAAAHAYCPYSRFRVGAAALAEDGRVFRGCNVENASYGLTVCAERNAVAAAVAAGARRIAALAVVADGEALPYPCGACRQVLAEFAVPRTRVFVARLTALEGYESLTVEELQPKPFAFRREES